MDKSSVGSKCLEHPGRLSVPVVKPISNVRVMWLFLTFGTLLIPLKTLKHIP